MKADLAPYRRQIVRGALIAKACVLIDEIASAELNGDALESEWLAQIGPIIERMNAVREIYDMLVAK